MKRPSLLSTKTVNCTYQDLFPLSMVPTPWSRLMYQTMTGLTMMSFCPTQKIYQMAILSFTRETMVSIYIKQWAFKLLINIYIR